MSALVESPLQLLCAVETYASDTGARPTRVTAREDVPALARSVRSVQGLGLPDGLAIETGPPRIDVTTGETCLVGDAFSGVFQASLARGGTPERIVVVDDGLATLELARRLVDGSSLVRLATPTRPLRYALGRLATRRLRRLAREGRVTLSTMLPLEPGLRDDLDALGVDVVRHSFDWLASREPHRGADDSIQEPTVVVGSALVADRLVGADHYVAWLRGVAADGPVHYVPHRRHDPLVTALFQQLPGVTVAPPGAAVEIRLRNLTRRQRVVALPSTSTVTLTRLLVPRGVAVLPHDVPDEWWTHRADPTLRRHLGTASALARAAAEEARSTQRFPIP
ncbi:hypothetical protein [Isoptericola sp. AK164]|uniref:hypothetical protein n=1 Tax=Isoptericola sp. AK164 TaxID=3024246 RepID=UPI002418A8ED|nr:hypothetical protein [Isoptericola sp. AK164]